jgi:hypothetical protein
MGVMQNRELFEYSTYRRGKGLKKGGGSALRVGVQFLPVQFRTDIILVRARIWD